MLRHLPNFICLVRIALIWPTVVALQAGHYWTALVLVAVCAISDGLDGWLAKRFNWTSHLGKILDPLADKLLLVALYLTATWSNLIPWWLTAVVVGRDVMIGSGAVVYRMWFGPLHGRPTILSKINTGMQLAVVLAAILGAATGLPTPEMVMALAILTLAHHPRVRRGLPRDVYPAGARQPVSSSMRQMTLGVQLKERATFESFLTGRNQELIAHLKHAVAATPPGTTWLAGPHAAGKSHLLQAVCAGLGPGKRAAYLPLETLLPFGPGTLDGVESLDVACYDDVQVVAGLEDWEQRLFSLWQRALERGSLLLFAARENPAARRFRAAGSQVPPGILGGVRGARTQ